ncbi:MAG: (d)CMP kinase [Acidaminobacteraceae bacterium]
MSLIQIAIDGPAGSGKSTIAKKVAKLLDILYLDTGAMYRAITLKLINKSIAFDNIDEISNILTNTNISFDKKRVLLDGVDVTEEIRMPIIDENVSKVASLKTVRIELVHLQQNIAGTNSIIMDGRDIATRVLPNAEFKFFLTASVDERAKRRYKERISNGVDVNLESLKEEIISRDKQDTERVESPLLQADDALLIDTTGLSIEGVVNEILKHVNK